MSARRRGPAAAAVPAAVLTATLTAAILTAAPPLHAQVAMLAPADQADRDPTLARFRAELLGAVERRDTAFVLDALADDILTSFGGDGGVAEFRQMWFAGERPRGEGIWAVLAGILRGGGRFSDDATFLAPYTFADFPDSLDAFVHGVVTGTGVRVRAEPGLDGAILTHLSHAVVPVADWQDTARADGLAWLRIALADGRRAWIAERYVRSPLDYRAVIVRRDGQWRIRSLVAGD